MTPDKSYWAVPYTIEGEVTIHAETAGEAQIKFQEFTKDQLARYGELIQHDPCKLPDDYDHDAASEGIDGISG